MTKKIEQIKELRLKYTFRAVFMWEAIMGKPFELDGTFTSAFYFVWCLIEANNPGALTMSDLSDSIDADPAVWEYLQTWLAGELTAQNELRQGDKGGKKK